MAYLKFNLNLILIILFFFVQIQPKLQKGSSSQLKIWMDLVEAVQIIPIFIYRINILKIITRSQICKTNLSYFLW